jgi:hypothetical protein
MFEKMLIICCIFAQKTAHIDLKSGSSCFGSGMFYLMFCFDYELMLENWFTIFSFKIISNKIAPVAVPGTLYIRRGPYSLFAVIQHIFVPVHTHSFNLLVN